MFVQFLEENLRESAIIGFPAAEGWKDHCPEGSLTLDWLLEHHEKLVKDTDVDIQVSSGGMTTKYQITRFVFPQGKKPLRNLAKLIEKKCRFQQPDPSLNLLVSIEKTPNISEDELRHLLKKTAIPFGSIILLMKASTAFGEVKYCMLHPKLVIGKTIRLDLPI